MTGTDREFLLQKLADSTDAFLRSIEGLSEAQLRFKPHPDRWSITDCIEHIAVTEDTMYGLTTQGVANPKGVSLDSEKEGRFITAVVERHRKVQAPEHVRPTGRFASTDEARTHFLKGRERATEYTRNCCEDVRRLFAVHPLLGEIDCYRFLLLLALHPARHAVQIEEIKADPAFPKS